MSQKRAEGSRRALTREKNRILLSSSHRVSDDVSGFVSEQRGLEAADGGGRSGVAQIWQHFLRDVLLEKLQRPSGGGVVAVDHFPAAEWSEERAVLADDVIVDVLEQFRGILPFFSGDRLDRTRRREPLATGGQRARVDGVGDGRRGRGGCGRHYGCRLAR